MGLTSPLSVACPALALPVRGAVFGQWIRPTGQAWMETQGEGLRP